jgi:pimeloyl-ACP methyl ester carboxylesterase
LPTETQNPEEKSYTVQGPTGASGTGDKSPVQERWVDLPDGRMRYLKAGSGRPLILVHGLMGYSFSWRFAIPALAPHATVYAIDNLGAGFSTAREGMDCRVRATAERLLQFADAMELREFDLLGTSHGGAVAIMVAAVSAERNDGRLRRLVLVAPVNPWSSHGKQLAPFLGAPFGQIIFRNTLERWRSFDVLFMRRLFGSAARIPLDSLEGYRLPLIKNHGLRHGARILKNWTADLTELETALPKIRDYPTLLIWGTHDGAVEFQSAEPLRRNFRSARLVAFRGVGHLPYEEAPEEFNRTLIDFVTSENAVKTVTV